MKRLQLFLFSFILGCNIYAQDIHFTQSSQVPMLINPAATGVFNGWERVTMNHKNQWINSGTSFYTSSIHADMNILKPERGTGAYLGLGLQLYNDIGGDSKFGTRQALLSVSGVVPLDNQNSLSVGVQAGFGQKFGEFTSLRFGNQFNGEEFSGLLNSGEINNISTFMYPDVSTGVFYRFSNQKIGFAHDDATDFRFGVAYYHLNRPTLKYRLGNTENLYSKWVFHTSMIKEFSGSPYGFEAYANVFSQGPHTEILLGALLRYRLKNGGKITGLNRDAYFSTGLNVRVNDAVAPVLFIELNSFKFGISYDITTSVFGSYYRGGGFEFSLQYANIDFALFKRR